MNVSESKRRRVPPGFYGPGREARPGERCMCGRAAVVVKPSDELGEVGYCGLAGAPEVVPCVFCGARVRHNGGRCPDYRLSADPTPPTPAGEQPGGGR